MNNPCPLETYCMMPGHQTFKNNNDSTYLKKTCCVSVGVVVRLGLYKGVFF